MSSYYSPSESDIMPLFSTCDACGSPIDPSNDPIILGDPQNPVRLPAPDSDCVYHGKFCSQTCFSYHYQY